MFGGSKNKLTINGKTYNVSGKNIEIRNNQIFVDGKLISNEAQSGSLELKWEGEAANIKSDGDVRCGDVSGSVDAGGNVECKDVSDYVEAGGNVSAGNVGGYIDCGGNVSAGDVQGEIDAGGNVTCKKNG